MPKTSMANIAFNLDGPLPRFLILLRLLELVPRRSTAAELVDGPILHVAAVGSVLISAQSWSRCTLPAGRAVHHNWRAKIVSNRRFKAYLLATAT